MFKNSAQKEMFFENLKISNIKTLRKGDMDMIFFVWCRKTGNERWDYCGRYNDVNEANFKCVKVMKEHLEGNYDFEIGMSVSPKFFGNLKGFPHKIVKQENLNYISKIFNELDRID